MIRLGLRILGKIAMEVKYLFITSHQGASDIHMTDGNLELLVKVVFSRFLCLKLLSFILSMLYSLEASN